MEVKIDVNQQQISRGDIVRYAGRNCIVVEERFTPSCMPINLETGVVIEGYSNIVELRKVRDITLLAKLDEVVLNKKKQEVPF